MDTTLSTGNAAHGRVKLAERYLSLLGQARTPAREELLQQAYEVGREAVLEGLGITDIVSMHCSAMLQSLGSEKSEDRAGALRVAQDCLEEALAPFEMVYRGFREANDALRGVNELLEQEAKRMAHSLHDEVGQLVASMGLAVDCLSCERSGPTACSHRAQYLRSLVDEAETVFRRLSHEMRPTILEDLGLGPALRFLAEGFSARKGLEVTVRDETNRRLCPPAESMIYRAAQVALTNVAQHSQAKNVTVWLSESEGWMVCSIKDDGKGMDLAVIGAHSEGLGLRGIRERAHALGGKLEIHPVSPQGLEIRVSVPLE